MAEREGAWLAARRSGFNSRSLHQHVNGFGPEAEGYRLQIDRPSPFTRPSLVSFGPSRQSRVIASGAGCRGFESRRA